MLLCLGVLYRLFYASIERSKEHNITDAILND